MPFALVFVVTSLGAVWSAFALCVAMAQVWKWICEIAGGEESYAL